MKTLPFLLLLCFAFGCSPMYTASGEVCYRNKKVLLEARMPGKHSEECIKLVRDNYFKSYERHSLLFQSAGAMGSYRLSRDTIFFTSCYTTLAPWSDTMYFHADNQHILAPHKNDRNRIDRLKILRNKIR